MRKPLLGRVRYYDCHGLALSRADVHNYRHRPPTSQLYFEQDGYVEIQQVDANTGDIILYCDPNDGSVSHSGIVIGVKEIVGSVQQSSLDLEQMGSRLRVPPQLRATAPTCLQHTTFFGMSHWEPPAIFLTLNTSWRSPMMCIFFSSD